MSQHPIMILWHRGTTDTLRRRAVMIRLLAALLACVCATSHAASPAHVALLETFDVPVILEHTKYFLSAMEKLGYKREQITILKANGDPKVASQVLRAEIARHKPDVIVANATLASKVAYQIGKEQNIPVVFMVVSDPVGAGIVANASGPTHDDITGVVHSLPRSVKIDMVMRILRSKPGVKKPIRFGYIHTNYPSSVGDLKMLQEAAKERGDVEFIPWTIPYPEKNFDIRRLADRLNQGVSKLEPQIDYWWVPQDPVAELDEVVRFIAEHSQHPIACGTNIGNIVSGALVYIAADTESGANEAALMVDSVLKGHQVGSIPVHSPIKIDFGVNLDTAQKIGVAIPSDLMELAESRVIRQK
ncbi:MAG TPA: ABC transporter substrate binding protein [Aquabacterium sp.]|nr:ABC transporter substrate binding protein [Aquabacterium sp.]